MLFQLKTVTLFYWARLEYISIRDVETSVNLSLKQKKAIDLIEVGFEEQGINLLLKSYEGKDEWKKHLHDTWFFIC